MTIHQTLSSVHISFARVSSCLYVCALSSFFLERLRASGSVTVLSSEPIGGSKNGSHYYMA